MLVAKIRLQAAWDALTNIQVGETDYCHVEKDFDDKYVLRACMQFKLGEQELRLVTDTPLSEALSQTIDLIQILAALLFLSITGAIVLGILVQRNFIRPIQMLSETAEAITAGALERRAEIKYDDEIGSLANNFNTMAARLVETIDSLRNEIGERRKAEEGLYRIAQEALNNALKHASAKNVTIRIINEYDKIEMVIEDDGICFETGDNLNGTGGMGMDNIRERAEKPGGSIQVLSSPEKGTKIRFSVPGNSQ